MINALRYEPRGQRQRFEPREQQSGEREKQEMTFFHLFWLLSSVQPLISAILFAWVSREVRALSPAATAHRRLSLVIVSGMMLMLLAGLLLNLFAMLSRSMLVSQLLFLPAICAAVIVAICTLFGFFRSRESTQAGPKDASPSDVAASRERGYYPVDGNEE